MRHIQGRGNRKCKGPKEMRLGYAGGRKKARAAKESGWETDRETGEEVRGVAGARSEGALQLLARKLTLCVIRKKSWNLGRIGL